MPEIKETEKERKVTRSQIIGTDIINVSVFNANVLSHINIQNFSKNVVGSKILNIQRRGKFYIFNLSCGQIIMHLKQSGQMCAVDKSTRRYIGQLIAMELSSGFSIRLIDRCAISKLYFDNNKDTSNKTDAISSVPLSVINMDYLTKWCSVNDMPIRDALLDKTMFISLGDMYTDELLFRCGIHPNKNCKDVDKEEITRILDQLPVAVQWGLEVHDMAEDGRDKISSGSYHNMNNRNVYERDTLLCNKCGTRIERIKISNRVAYFCPNCQSMGGDRRLQASDVTPEILAPVAQFIGAHIQTIGYFSLYMIPDVNGKGVRDYAMSWEEFVACAYDYIHTPYMVNKDYGDGTPDQSAMKKYIKSMINDDSFTLGVNWIQKQNWR